MHDAQPKKRRMEKEKRNTLLKLKRIGEILTLIGDLALGGHVPKIGRSGEGQRGLGGMGQAGWWGEF